MYIHNLLEGRQNSSFLFISLPQTSLPLFFFFKEYYIKQSTVSIAV